MMKAYYRLAKPGIVYGNAIHTLAGSLFAWSVVGARPVGLIGGLVGTSIVIASACVVNNVTDRHIDKKMKRTEGRPLVKKMMSVRAAIIYAIVLGLVGSAILVTTTNLLTLFLALLCHFTYTVVYGYAKRHTWLSTVIGTIPGALPMMAGYTAVDPHLTPLAWLLGGVILLWQIPHFYALSIYRRDEYAAAKLPILAVVASRQVVVRHLIGSALLYELMAIALVVVAPILRVASGLILLGATLWVGFILIAPERGSDAWAKQVFRRSLFMPLITFLAAIVAVAVA